MAITQVRACIDGQWYTLAYNASTRFYEAEIIPQRTSQHEDGGRFDVTLEALNDSGAVNTADASSIPALALLVRETTAPILAAVSPLEGYVTSSTPVIILSASDGPDGSGIAPESVSMTVDGVPVDAHLDAVTDGYHVTYTPQTPFSDGSHVLHLSVLDRDGNAASKEFRYVIDTVAPVIYLDAIAEITDAKEVTISGRTLDVTSPPVTLSVDGNSVAVSDNGAFSYTAPLDVGDNRFAVRAMDAAGLLTEMEVYVLRLVTDRTQGDVQALQEMMSRSALSQEQIAEFNLGRSKGAYNASDLNRVTTALEVLDRKLHQYGYLSGYQALRIQHKSPVFEDGEAAGFDTWEDNRWIKWDIPQYSQLMKYLHNVENASAAMPLPPDAPQLPESMEKLSVEAANNIEKVLVLTDTFFAAIDRTNVYAGEIFCGEV